MSAEKIMNETTVAMTVTPEMAAEWLARNTRNRTINAAHVARLAEEIRNGRWRSTHQGIAFGADGTLYDGQHRLHAVIKAGVAVTMRVTFGLPVEALDAIDVGEGRNAADVLAIADGRHVTRTKRAVTLAAMTLVQNGGYQGEIRKTSVTRLRDALTAFESHFDALDLSMQNNRLAQAPVLGSMLICHALHPAAAVDFARVYRDASGTTKDHPAAALREHVLLRYVSGNNTVRTDVAARTFSAFHAFRHSLTRKHIKPGKALMLDFINAWRVSRGMAPLGADADVAGGE